MKRLYKISLGIVLVFLLLVILSSNSKKPKTGDSAPVSAQHNFSIANVTKPYGKITIVGDMAFSGFFDPALEYNEDGSVGWMAYSSITMSYINTAIATTTDQGKTWTHVTTVNPSVNDTLMFFGKSTKGLWQNEVSTLVHDPDDPDREWKLYWHKYFSRPPHTPSDRLFTHGWIAYKYASSPEGPWSDEIPLFGAGEFPPAPHSVKYNLNLLDSDLKAMVAYTEPGSLYKDGVLYLSLTAHPRDNPSKNIVILLASMDHGGTWQYKGKLLNNKDALGFGYTYFTGSALFASGNETFLLASPFRSDLYNGTMIFEFDDLSNGLLKRDAQGELIVKVYIPLSFGYQGGQADYDPYNTIGGIITSELAVSPGQFKSWNQLERTPDTMVLQDTQVFV